MAFLIIKVIALMQKVEEGHFKRSGVCVGVCVGMWEDHTTGLEDSGKKPLKSHMEGFEDGDVKSKKRKRNLCTVADDECHVMTLENFYKRTILALTKPSYLLGLGFNHVRPENRVRLCHFLQKLVRQHNWMEASGVLSLLLKGTCKDNDPTMNRFKYLVWTLFKFLIRIHVVELCFNHFEHFITWILVFNVEREVYVRMYVLTCL